MTPSIIHTLMVGASRSGKSQAMLGKMMKAARSGLVAIVLMDPHGTLAREFFLRLAVSGKTKRVIYDRLQDTDCVVGYDWLVPSTHSDPFQRRAENDERIREFINVLLRREGSPASATKPQIEEWMVKAAKLFMHQKTRVPIYWLIDALTFGSDAYWYLTSNVEDTDEGMEAANAFRVLAGMNATQQYNLTSPAQRRLRAVCGSPSFMARSGNAFDSSGFLEKNGILILDGSTSGNLSQDAAATMMHSVLYKVIQHARNRGTGKIMVVLDEAINAGLIGLPESQALAECGKWGLEFHILIQNPNTFPSEAIKDNVLQNCWRHEWFRQGNPEAAKLAALDIATPQLNPLQVHHIEYHTRTVDDGYEYVPTNTSSVSKDAKGKTTSKSATSGMSIRAKRKEVREEQARYTTLNDQILMFQSQLMNLDQGYRFVRSDTVSPNPEYVPMLEQLAWFRLPGLAEKKFQKLLEQLKSGSHYRKPEVSFPTSSKNRSAPAKGAKKRFNGGKGTS